MALKSLLGIPTQQSSYTSEIFTKFKLTYLNVVGNGINIYEKCTLGFKATTWWWWWWWWCRPAKYSFSLYKINSAFDGRIMKGGRSSLQISTTAARWFVLFREKMKKIPKDLQARSRWRLGNYIPSNVYCDNLMWKRWSMLLIDIRSTNASAAEFILNRLKLYLAGRHRHDDSTSTPPPPCTCARFTCTVPTRS